MFGGWLLGVKSQCDCAEMNNRDLQRLRDEDLKLNGPWLTRLWIPSHSFSRMRGISVHPAYVRRGFLCSNSSMCLHSSRWRAASQACGRRSDQSSGCLVYTSSEQRPRLSLLPAPDEARPLLPCVARVSILPLPSSQRALGRGVAIASSSFPFVK